MRIAYLTIIAAAALATFVAGTTLIAQPRRTPSTAPLFPLSERDLETNESGCECSFRIGRRVLVWAINDDLIIRTGGGRQVCRTNDEQFSAISDGRGTVRCAGITMTVRRTGRLIVDEPSESAEAPAALRISQGRMRRTLTGRWTCAC